MVTGSLHGEVRERFTSRGVISGNEGIIIVLLLPDSICFAW